MPLLYVNHLHHHHHISLSLSLSLSLSHFVDMNMMFVAVLSFGTSSHTKPFVYSKYKSTYCGMRPPLSLTTNKALISRFT